MDAPFVAELLTGLPRPEYVAAPEVLISSLAWGVLDLELSRESSKPLALAYRTDVRTSSRIDFRSTSPRPDEMCQWASALVDAGLEVADDGATLALATANSIAGVRAKRAKGQAATPLTPALALLQNANGMMGKENPPRIDLIIETMYRLGRAPLSVDKDQTAAGRWLDAAERRMGGDALLRAIDRAVQSELLPGKVLERKDRDVAKVRVGALTGDTPFTWFTNTWDKLTSDAWVDALPARRWVDWATTVLRAAISFGYLWEARYYEVIARSVVEGRVTEDTFDSQELLDGIGTLIPWVNRREKVTVRDVNSNLKSTIRRGDHVRVVLREWLKSADPFLSIEQGLGEMARDQEAVERLQGALSATQESGSNTSEAVRYSLLTRERSGPFADHYGLLVTRGTRYLLVEPATEWIAVVASLATPGPGQKSTIGDLHRSLTQLGLHPDYQELIGLLEASGLARGSADADQAVVYQSAY